jgi:PAS domain S-box-containing protein
MQAALAEQEAQTRLVIDTALDAVIVMDADGIIRGWNAQAEKTFGWPLAEAVGKSLLETIIPIASRADHARELREFGAAGESPRLNGQGNWLNGRTETTALHRSGREFPVELSITPMRVGDGWIFSVFARDITERKKAEARLRESEARFHKAFEASPALMALTRLEDGRFIAANQTFYKTSGYTEAEVIGHRALSLNIYAVPQQREEYVARIRAHGAVRDLECPLRTKDGSVRTMLLSGELIDLDGEPHLLSVGLDITGRKEAEIETLKALSREKELSELKSSFVSMVSHEFRTPLGVIQSASDVLDRYLDRLSPEKRRKHLDMIFRSTRNLAQLVEGVLLLGKVEEGRLRFTPEPLDLPNFCSQLIDEVHSATGRQCPIALTASGALEGASCDTTLLRHIFGNLLSNAVNTQRRVLR